MPDERVIADDQRGRERRPRGDEIVGAAGMGVDARVGGGKGRRERHARIAPFAAHAALEVVADGLRGDGRSRPLANAAEPVGHGKQHDPRGDDLRHICFPVAALRGAGSRANRYLHAPTPRNTKAAGPTVSSSSTSNRRGAVTSVPLTNVPFRLPRSST
jgi:hypothetical protein